MKRGAQAVSASEAVPKGRLFFPRNGHAGVASIRPVSAVSVRRVRSPPKLRVLGYPRLAAGTYDDEQRYAHLQPKQEDRWQRHAIETLERLSYRVVLEELA